MFRYAVVAIFVSLVGACDFQPPDPVAEQKPAKAKPVKPMSVVDEEWRHLVVIAINEDDEIYIQEQRATLVELKSRLKELASNSQEIKILIVGNKDASYRRVLEVNEIAIELNIPVMLKTQ